MANGQKSHSTAFMIGVCVGAAAAAVVVVAVAVGA